MYFKGKTHFYFALVIFNNVYLSQQKENKTCLDIPKLNIVPGIGWDALTNRDTQQLIHLSYNQCLTTNDGKYLIPDNTVETVLNKEQLYITAEIIEHWANYTAPTSAKFKVATDIWPEQFLPLYYSFSDEYQEFKKLQVENQAFTCRCQIQQRFYQISTTSETVIDNFVKERFLQVIQAVKKSKTEKAKYLTEMIVNDYGTHYTKDLIIGAMFVKEDYILNELLQAYSKEKANIVSAAKISFLNDMGLSSIKIKVHSNLLLDAYSDFKIDERIRLFGQLSLKNDSIGENIVDIDRSGDFLTDLVTPLNFPNVSSSLLVDIKQMLEKAIQDYYKRNIHNGCTQSTAINFDYKANLDDGFCNLTSVYYDFGGVYRDCEKQANAYHQNQCMGHYRNNLLTKNVNCSTGFTRSLIHSEHKSYRYDIPGIKYWTYDYVQLKTFACISNWPVKKPKYYFGGLYSTDVNNTHTKNISCPLNYEAIPILYGNLVLCIAALHHDDMIYDLSLRVYALPFGGFATCSTEFQCPIGYEKHLAVVYKGEKIYYCLHEPNVIHYDVVPRVSIGVIGNVSFLFDEETSNEIFNENENEIIIFNEDTNITLNENQNEGEKEKLQQSHALRIKTEYFICAITLCLFMFL